MPDHDKLPPSLALRAGQGAVDPQQHESALQRAAFAERELRLVIAQRNILAAVIRHLLDGEAGEAADVMRAELGKLTLDIPVIEG
jgi:hypothetical protein